MQENVIPYSEFYKSFCDKYQNKIVPLVQKYETERVIRLIIASIIFLTLFVLASIIMFLAFTDKSSGKLAELAGYIYVAAFLFWYWVKKKFENSIKTKIMPFVCSCFENMHWSSKEYYQGELFTQAGVVSKFNSCTYDDIFTGMYKDVNFEIIEAEYVSGSGKYRSTVFKGVVVKIDLNKPFNSHTVI